MFLADCRRVLTAADRAARRVQMAARGEVRHAAPRLHVDHGLGHGPEVAEPSVRRSSAAQGRGSRGLRRRYSGALARRPIRPCDRPDDLLPAEGFVPDRPPRTRSVLPSATLTRSPSEAQLKLTTLADRPFELWPRAMAPGFYDTILGACRAAGFDPTLDDQARATPSGAALRAATASDRSTRRSRNSSHGASRSWTSNSRPRVDLDAVWHQRELPLGPTDAGNGGAARRHGALAVGARLRLARVTATSSTPRTQHTKHSKRESAIALARLTMAATQPRTRLHPLSIQHRPRPSESIRLDRAMGKRRSPKDPLPRQYLQSLLGRPAPHGGSYVSSTAWQGPLTPFVPPNPNE